MERAERRIDLEAARDAKYREIRDAELDHQTGKLSDADYNAIYSTLRAEALALLRELDTFDAVDDFEDPEELELDDIVDVEDPDDLELDDLSDSDEPDDIDGAR